MLNPKTNERELAYVVYVDDIEPIPGRDRVECARVGGWTCMVPKDAFKVGDPAIYFEIDSQVPLDNPVFTFCAKYKGHIKTQKFKTPDGQFWSQGLLMAAADFGWTIDRIEELFITDDEMVRHIPGTDSAFLTEKLGVTYYEPKDNKRKAKINPDAKINAALGRHPMIAKKYGRFIKSHKWSRKLFLLFFGRKKDVRKWPVWVVKTDEERVQNMPWILQDKSEWYATEKIDGTSTTFTMKRGKGLKKSEFYVCSRNVVFDTPEKAANCYYDSNVYLEMAEKYNMREVLADILNQHPDLEFVTIQGETYGAGIQKRDYGMKDHDLAVFNFIIGGKDESIKRYNPIDMKNVMDKYNIPCVPIVDEHFILPDTIEELLEIATGKSAVDGGMREGLVFRSYDGAQSFKAVSNEFLMKYHNG